MVVRAQQYIMLSIGTAIFLAACDNSEVPTVELAPVLKQLETPAKIPEATLFAEHVSLSAYQALTDALEQATELESRVVNLLEQPNDDNLQLAQGQWRLAYSSYLSALASTRIPGNDPPEWGQANLSYRDVQALLDSWPIEGGYIDYVPGYALSGIVNDLTLTISAETLLDQHGFSDPSYASIGYHPLEFMLWGEDGLRQATDFDDKKDARVDVTHSNSDDSADSHADEYSNLDASVSNHQRRRNYLLLASQLLQQHLQRLQRRWEPANGYYASVVQATTAEKVLQASLLAGQNLLRNEVLQRRLTDYSSPYSQSTPADVGAVINGLKQLYFPAAESSGLNVLLGDNADLMANWSSGWDNIDTCVVQWHDHLPNEEEARQLCRQRVIELMAVLERSARTLGVKLPANG
ncbi:imelysin family protein [Thalassolituus sp.]|uniref:imelysin family protein n=1 Tax=Thalassolituus sp. TaxID=2030822 RepID=UPI002A82144B|nr:imelysin family protein [Thalassolituus sp.]